MATEKEPSPEGPSSSSARQRRGQRNGKPDDNPPAPARARVGSDGDARDGKMGIAVLTLIGLLAAIATAYWLVTTGVISGRGGGRSGRPSPPNMELRAIARQLLHPEKGILAADESPATFGKRLRPGVANSPDLRRRWRRLLLATPGLEQHISGVILHAETFRQLPEELAAAAARGLALGVKLDEGLASMGPKKAGEFMSKGLEGLAERCAALREAGAAFAKWRAVFRVGRHTPSGPAVRRNAEQLAEFAAVAQRCGLLPVLEPELLAEGDHNLQRGAAAAARVLKGVFRALRARGDVDPGAMLLKVAMVTPGDRALGPLATPDQVANATLRVLLSTVPRVVPGIVFLSGGQSEPAATANLLALGQLARERAGGATEPAAAGGDPRANAAAAGARKRRRPAEAAADIDSAAGEDGAGSGTRQRRRSAAAKQPQQQEKQMTSGAGAGAAQKPTKPSLWSLSFSFGRALQASALEAWLESGDEAAAQRALLQRARANAAAQQGREPPLEA